MKTKTKWTVSDTRFADYVGTLEFQDKNKGKWLLSVRENKNQTSGASSTKTANDKP